MEKGYQQLIEALAQQRRLYEQMKTMAVEAMRATGEPPAAVARADDRAGLIEKLKVAQKKVSALMMGPAGAAMIEKAEAATLIRQITLLIEETQAALGQSEKEVEAAMAKITGELGGMNKGKKAMAHYGDAATKNLFSRFIEKKG